MPPSRPAAMPQPQVPPSTSSSAAAAAAYPDHSSARASKCRMNDLSNSSSISSGTVRCD